MLSMQWGYVRMKYGYGGYDALRKGYGYGYIASSSSPFHLLHLFTKHTAEQWIAYCC